MFSMGALLALYPTNNDPITHIHILRRPLQQGQTTHVHDMSTRERVGERETKKKKNGSCVFKNGPRKGVIRHALTAHTCI